MKSVKRIFLVCNVVALSMSLMLSLAASAAVGGNLYISGAAWGQLIDNTGAPVEAKGSQITIPVAITSAQGTILVTTPGTGTTDDEKSAPLFDMASGTYKNVVYIDQVSAPTGNVYNYTFNVDSQQVTKDQILYVKVGGTDVPAGDNQKATTTYLGTSMPGVIGDYSAANVSGDLVITTPTATWTAPKVSITISEGGLIKEVTSGITVTSNSITVSKSTLVAAFPEVTSGSMTITGIKIIDSLIEDITLSNQNIVMDLAVVVNPPVVTADDIANMIVGLNTATMEYAISTNGGTTYGNYSSDAAPALGGSKTVKVRVKEQGASPASADVILTFTPNFGDVDGDGLINISDVIMAAEIAVGYQNYTTEQKIRANVSDKLVMTVDISDVVLIIERAVGGTTVFPIDMP